MQTVIQFVHIFRQCGRHGLISIQFSGGLWQHQTSVEVVTLRWLIYITPVAHTRCLLIACFIQEIVIAILQQDSSFGQHVLLLQDLKILRGYTGWCIRRGIFFSEIIMRGLLESFSISHMCPFINILSIMLCEFP